MLMRTLGRACKPLQRSRSIKLGSFFPFRAGATRAMSTKFDVSIGLSEDQLEYQQVALNFAANELAPYAAEWDEKHYWPQETMQKAAELGFGGIYVDPDIGGTGLTRKDAAVIFEALATGDVSTSAYMTIHNMCSWLLDSFGNTEQREKYLPSMVTMEKFSSYCLTEPGSGSDAASLSTKAVKDGDDYVLNGAKAFISGGGRSDLYFVMARTSNDGAKGVSCFIVEKGTKGLSFGAQEKKLGWNNMPTSAVIFEECRIPKANLIGKEGEGFTFAMKALDGGRINIGTTAIGGAISAFDHAVEHVSMRKQFGKPISAFQNTQFKLADMATEIQESRLLIQCAADLLDNKHPGATAMCAMAKRSSTDKAFNVANGALQLYGGYGYLKDYPIERIVRDLRVHSILEGTNEVMRLIISRNLIVK